MVGELGHVAATHADADIVARADDIAVSISARGAMACARALKMVGDMAVEETEQKLRVPFSSEKAAVLATTRELEVLPRRRSERQVGFIAGAVRSLGYGVALGSAGVGGRAKVRTGRLATAR